MHVIFCVLAPWITASVCVWLLDRARIGHAHGRRLKGELRRPLTAKLAGRDESGTEGESSDQPTAPTG